MKFTTRMFGSMTAKAALVALVCGAFCFSAATADAAKVFKLSNQMPPTHHISVGLHSFAEKVKEYSKGEMEVQVYDAGALYRDAEIVKAIRGGSVEMGFAFTNRWPGLIQATDIFDTPFLFRNLDDLAYFQKEAGPLMNEAFAKYGVQMLCWIDYGWNQFWNNKRPLKTPEDFKGLTMRSFSPSDAETLKALGAAPTIMSSSELYMALQRGTIDGTTTGMPAGISRKVIEVQKYLTVANYSLSQGLLQANLKWWKSLTAAEREIITKAALETEAYVRELTGKAEESARADVAKAGLEIHDPTPAEREAFIKATAPVREAYLQKAGDMGTKLLKIVENIPQ